MGGGGSGVGDEIWRKKKKVLENWKEVIKDFGRFRNYFYFKFYWVFFYLKDVGKFSCFKSICIVIFNYIGFFKLKEEKNENVLCR